MSSIADLLREIEKRELILPEFQRGFVWSRAKVKAYIESIYKNYPTGSPTEFFKYHLNDECAIDLDQAICLDRQMHTV